MFAPENRSCLPSESQFGKLRSGNKLDLLSCLEKSRPSQHDPPDIDALIVNDAAVFNMLKPNACKTFL